MPFNRVSTAMSDGQIQAVRMVCDRYGRCYNARRAIQPYYAQRYNDRPAYYGDGPRHGYGAPAYGRYDRPGVGIGIGPVGVRVF